MRRILKTSLIVLTLVLLTFSFTPVKADDNAGLISGIEQYTQVLLTPAEVDQLIESECAWQYSSLPTMKVLTKGILVRALYLSPCSNQYFETMVLFAPRNFRIGEGLSLLNVNYKTIIPPLRVGDWSSIVTMDFSNPALLFTRNNAWVFIRGWEGDSEINSNYSTDLLLSVGQSLSQKLPESFLTPSIPEARNLAKAQTNPSASNMDWQNSIYFYPSDKANPDSQMKTDIRQEVIETNFSGRWKTFDDMTIKVNDTEGTVRIDIPATLDENIEIIHTRGFPSGEIFMQSWKLENSQDWSGALGTLLPGDSLSVVRLLDLDQKIFYQDYMEAGHHYFYILSGGQLLAKYDFTIHLTFSDAE